MSCTFWGILRDRLLVNQRLTRRIIAFVLGTLVLPLFLAVSPACSAEPRFRADGPEADAYGRAEGYPRCEGLAYIRELGCRVGALSQLDELFPARTIRASGTPAPLARAATEPAIRYDWAGQSRTLDQFLDTQHVTGLLIARGNTIHVERYQYGRTDRDRLTSFSMAKTMIGLLIGLAVEEGAIKSIDDPAEAYVPGLTGSEYGRTPIRALLQMASGVAFREVYSDFSSDVYRLASLTLGQDPRGSPAVATLFNARYAPPGERFSYSSAESLVLGLVLAGATKRRVAEYASEKLWGPLGAEADASWNIDATGQEITFAYINAVLRDWARLGLMLAHDGMWAGRQVMPRQWLLDATTIKSDSPHWSSSMKPGEHRPGYGYQVWLIMAPHRTFALRGLRGQWVIVDPVNKLVLVQTSLQGGNDGELMALWASLQAQVP